MVTAQKAISSFFVGLNKQTRQAQKHPYHKLQRNNLRDHINIG